jgi:acyl-CoA hydrolase
MMTMAIEDHILVMPNASTITVMSNDKSLTRRAHLVIIDEAEYIPDLMRVVSEALARSARLIIGSTPSRVGSEFHTLHTEQLDSCSDHAHISLPWNSNPSRTNDWLNKTAANEYSRVQVLNELLGEFSP